MRAQTPASLLSRLWIYQSERLPLLRTGALVAVFASASISVSAQLAGRDFPPVYVFVASAMVTLVFFMHLRICDEFKDAEVDRRYRPERPVPRGLVSLAELRGVGIALVPLTLIAAYTVHFGVVITLLVVWGWMALMTVEFFVPQFLHTRPLLYLVSHMLIMPLIDVFITSCEWLRAHAGPPPGLWLFLVLSFINGCVIELGRKIYTPENERQGVETYSDFWGAKHAVVVWIGCTALALVFLIWVGSKLQATIPIAIVGMAGFAAMGYTGYRFWRAPDTRGQKRLDIFSGLWVLLCYGSAGFVPLLV